MLLLIFLITLTLGTLAEPLNSCKGRIIGGNQTDIAQIPFQVALNLSRGPLCGGSLISNRWILTAADCLESLNPTDKVQVRINSTYGLAHGRVVNIESVVVHPKYNRLTNDYDFALLELEVEIELSKKFYAAELPEKDEPVEGGTCVQVSGWGRTEDGYGSDDLRVINISVVNWKMCRQTFRRKGYISKQMICAGGGQEQTSACHGDSGGLVDGKKVVGVVSWHTQANVLDIL